MIFIFVVVCCVTRHHHHIIIIINTFFVEYPTPFNYDCGKPLALYLASQCTHKSSGHPGTHT